MSGEKENGRIRSNGKREPTLLAPLLLPWEEMGLFGLQFQVAVYHFTEVKAETLQLITLIITADNQEYRDKKLIAAS